MASLRRSPKGGRHLIYKRYKGRRLKPGDPDWDLGTWQVEFSLRGHYVKEAIPEARNKAQAERAETDMRQAIYDRRFNRASGTTQLSDFVDKVFLPYAAEKRSFKDDEQRVGVVKEFFRGWQVRDVTPMLIEKFKSDLRKRRTKFKREMSPATVNRYLQVLSKVLSLAYDNGLIDSNPMSRVRRLREPPPRERYLTGEEEGRLLEALRLYGERLEALGALGLDTGLRLSELLRLRWEDVREYDVHVRSDGRTARTKNDRPRNVPLTTRAKEILSSLRQGAPGHELVFDPKRSGRRRRQMLVCYTRALKVAGIEGATFHTLRHTFATRLRAAGVHEFDIMALLGHSSIKVTQGYAHSVESKLREAVALMSGSRVLEFQRKEAAG